MSRPPAPCHDDRIEPHACRPQRWPLREVEFGRALDTLLLSRTQGDGGHIAFFPRLDFDEADHAGRRACNEIDLAGMGTHAAAKDTIEFAHQEQRCERFAAPSAPLGLAPRRKIEVSLAHRATF
jgi:hypothetical protein